MLSRKIKLNEVNLNIKISPEIKGVKLSNIRRVHEIAMLQLKELDIGNKKTSANQ